MNQLIEQSVNEAFGYARNLARLQEFMDDPDWIETYSIFAKGKDGVEFMQEDAIGFEDSIVRRADMVIRELYRIDSLGIINVP